MLDIYGIYTACKNNQSENAVPDMSQQKFSNFYQFAVH